MKKVVLLTILLVLITGCGKKELVCLNGYTLNEENETCERVIEAKAKEVYHCEGSNVTLDGKQCRMTNYVPATATKKCNSGYTLTDGVCIKDGTVHNLSKCETNYTYSNSDGQCHKVLEAMTTYSCESGQLEGIECASISYVKADVEYVCEDSDYELEGNKCYKTIITKAKDSKN